jgi:cold-inducible RNA-binding protein
MFSIIKRFISKISPHPKSTNTLYVGNLIYSATTSDLKEAFSKFGPIENTRIIRDNRTRKSKGFGFVTYKSARYATEALSMEGQPIKGRPVRVRLANSK